MFSKKNSFLFLSISLLFSIFFFTFLVFFLHLCSFFLSTYHSDQMSEGSEVSKVTLCVKILKWQSATHWPRSGIELPGQLKNSPRILPAHKSVKAWHSRLYSHLHVFAHMHKANLYASLFYFKKILMVSLAIICL